MTHGFGLFPYPNNWLRTLYRIPIHLYRFGLGEVVNLWPVMIVTTRGRSSGQPRFTALEYRQHGSKLYVISGWGKRPNWYCNLQAHPDATIRIGKQVLRAKASVVTDPAESGRVLYMFQHSAPIIWGPLLARMSSINTIDLKTLREISDQFTVMRFDIQEETPALPVAPAGRSWLWPGVMFLVVGLLVVWLLRSNVNGRE